MEELHDIAIGHVTTTSIISPPSLIEAFNISISISKQFCRKRERQLPHSCDGRDSQAWMDGWWMEGYSNVHHVHTSSALLYIQGGHAALQV